MSDLVLIKTPSGALIAADIQTAECIARMKMGVGMRGKFAKVNNPAFHRKIFALAHLAFEAWEPEAREYKGEAIQKNFDQFREDITILAGFFETRVRLNGEIRFIAKSWSFDSMDDIEKERLYNAIINVVLSRILTKYTRNDLDRVLDQVLAFA